MQTLKQCDISIKWNTLKALKKGKVALYVPTWTDLPEIKKKKKASKL